MHELSCKDIEPKVLEKIYNECLNNVIETNGIIIDIKSKINRIYDTSDLNLNCENESSEKVKGDFLGSLKDLNVLLLYQKTLVIEIMNKLDVII